MLRTWRCARPWPTPSTGSRSRLSAEYGYQPAANQSGIVNPDLQRLAGHIARSQYSYTYDPGKADLAAGVGRLPQGPERHLRLARPAAALLHDHQRRRLLGLGGGRARHPDGPAAVGIELKVQNLSSDDYDTASTTGSSSWPTATRPAAPARTTSSGSGCTRPTRHRSASPRRRTGALQRPGHRRAAGPVRRRQDPKQQHQIMNQLQTVLLSDVPVIPVTEGVDWYEYNTNLQRLGDPDQPLRPARPVLAPTAAASAAPAARRATGRDVPVPDAQGEHAGAMMGARRRA